MANNLGSLVVSLGLDAAEFVRGLTKSEYQAQQWARRFETGIEAARTAALGSFAAIGTAVAVLDRQLEGIAGFQDLADKIGDTAEEVASLKLAADVSGTSLESVAAASVKLTAGLAKTDDESKGVALGLKAIGLEVDAFKALDPVAQLDAVAQALAGFEDGAGKTAVAMQLFGKSGADLIPMLNDLAEQGGRQVTLTAEQIKAADEYSKSTARLRSEVQTLVQVTAADAAPLMTQMVQILRETAIYSTIGADGVNLLSLSLRGAKTALEAVLVVASDVAFVFQSLGDFAGAYAAVTVSLIKGDVDGAKAIGDAYRAAGEERRKALDRYQSNVLNPATFDPNDQSAAEARRLGLTTAPRSLNFSAASGAGKNGAGAKDAGFTGLSYDQQIAQRVGKLFEDADINKAKEYADTLAYLDRLYFDAGISADQYDAALRKLTGSQAQAGAISKELSANERRVADEMKRLAELLASTESAGIEQQRRDMELLTQSLQDGLITEQEYLEAVTARLDLVGKQTDDAAERSKRLGDAYASTFNRMFTEGMKVGDMLKKLAFDAINIQFLTPATQKAGNWLGSAVSSAFGGFFADGGYLAPGKWGIAGERGPEPIFGGKTGLTIQPNGAGGAGGGVTIQQNFNFGNADASTVAQLRAEAARIKAETLAAVPGVVLQARRTSTGFANALRGG